MARQKRHGGQTKEERVAAREEKAKAKIVDQKLKSKEILAENYHNYMDILNKVALGTLGGDREVTVTNQVSTLKYLITLADEVLKAEEEKSGKGVEDEKSKRGDLPELISLDFTSNG